MTCIAAVVDGDRVCVGADTETTWGYTKRNQGSKIVRSGPLVIASTGLAAVGCALARRFSAPDEIGDADKYLYQLVPDAIRAALDGVHLIKNDGGVCEVSGGAAFIVAYKNRVCDVDCLLGVYEDNRGYTAHGSGGEVALGSLYSTEGNSAGDTEWRVGLAVEAAQVWSVGVGGGVDIEWTEA